MFEELANYPYKNRYVLLIGISSYEDDMISNLNYSFEDVEALYNVLINDNFFRRDTFLHVLADKAVDSMLARPTRSRILHELKLICKAVRPDDILIVYFSCHGMVVDDEPYLLCSDTFHSNIPETGISLTAIVSHLQDSAASAKILFLDSCHAGANIGKSGPSLDFFTYVHNLVQGIVILGSCQRNQFSYEWPELERSVFSFFLAEGLQGDADNDKKGFITIADIYRYLGSKVGNWALQNGRDQTPTLEQKVVGDIPIYVYKELKNVQRTILDPLMERIKTLPEVHPYEPQMIIVPAGEVLIGDDSSIYEEERPSHRVYLNTFAISRFPITNAQYAEFIKNTNYPPPFYWGQPNPPDEILDHPVNYLSWQDAASYCLWLREKTSRIYQLPSELQWEKAACWDPASGIKRTWPWGMIWEDKRCNTIECGLGHTSPVGASSPHGDSYYGVGDLVGNVWEWTNSLIKPYPYPYHVNISNELDFAHKGYIIKGGSFEDSKDFAKPTYRVNFSPLFLFSNRGFRCSITLDE